ncbi:hypothetical protein IMG5_017300 [Ichthyophthirius multifiliis]|uniref:sphingomyelin phosphodiesterase n=1 Tax=Ichthyophthirius multifiliis TaxID=5932 RepID=G0QKG1_ICHMU|nr:hypothetical protein IMG5_017300 [Ichthyophthirius multifiliis]EGR34302.1 hypothetical protein IMG5_017300 [Ichthyophthirius multifiliis]|eukprot:XP_004039606.1 hypothetical protein IMG5_017300 [Ichthyophthirius multifiliis]
MYNLYYQYSSSLFFKLNQIKTNSYSYIKTNIQYIIQLYFLYFIFKYLFCFQYKIKQKKNINQLILFLLQKAQNQKNALKLKQTRALNRKLTKKIKLLTYNVFLRPPLIKNNLDDYKNERTEQIINSLQNFDIVCFQEVFGFLNQRKHKIIQGAKQQGFLYYSCSQSPSFFSSYLVEGGLLTISRYPIIQTEYKPFKYGVLSDNLSQKGVLYNKIQIGNTYMHLFNTHLQASYIDGPEKEIVIKIYIKNNKQIYRKQQLQQKQTNQNIFFKININKQKQQKKRHFISLQQEKSFSEYDILKILLSNFNKNIIYDCVKKKYGQEIPITYGDYYVDENGSKQPMETVLTISSDLFAGQCLDYIIHFKENNQSDDQEKQVQEEILQVDYQSVEIEKFFVKEQPFTQLSDHYGVSIDVLYINQ